MMSNRERADPGSRASAGPLVFPDRYRYRYRDRDCPDSRLGSVLAGGQRRDLIAKEVKNWTLSANTARVEILLGTSYDSDPREVLEILVQTAREHEFVAEEPEPFAMMYEFGESSLDFRMFCHTTMDNRRVVIGDLHIRIFEALTAAGIRIPFPQRDLHVTSVDKSVSEFDRLSGAP